MDHDTTLLPGVAAWIDNYQPQELPPTLWYEVLRPFVVPALLRSCPEGIHSARIRALVLSRLAAWCVEQNIALELELALDPDTVERFIACAAILHRSRATYRSVLRRLGPALTRTAPWEPRPRSLSRRHIARPYAASELAALRCDAEHQSTPARRRAAKALIALGAGAGLDARWALDVHARDVTVADGIVSIKVGGQSARVVVVLAEFEDDVIDLAKMDGLLVGSRTTGRNRANKLASSIALGSGSPKLSLSRLRSTWLTTHLRLGTRLPELAAAAGLAGITVLSDLLAEIEPLDDTEAAAMLRGVR